MLQFNETSANLNYSSTSIPWIAYVSCDSAVQTATVPIADNATSTNATAEGNQTAMSYDLLQQAQDLGAVAVLLYSSRAQVRSPEFVCGWSLLTPTTVTVFTVVHSERDSVLWQCFLVGRKRHLRHLDEHDGSDLLDRIAAGGRYCYGTVWVSSH